jgi:hypothetical protein
MVKALLIGAGLTLTLTACSEGGRFADGLPVDQVGEALACRDTATRRLQIEGYRFEANGTYHNPQTGVRQVSLDLEQPDAKERHRVICMLIPGDPGGPVLVVQPPLPQRTNDR